MQIEERLIGEIKPYDKNAKKHPEKQVGQIVASIQEFGFNQPLVVDKDDVLVVGHGRYLAAQALGLEKVPVLKLNVTAEQAKAYRLADNKLNESDWDMQMVVQELKELSLPMLDLTGFSRDLIVKNDDKDDDVPEVPVKAKSMPGDLYELGDHRLFCGDATKIEDVKKLMDGAKADMVFTDPPYNVNYKGGGEKTSTHIMNDKMGDQAFRQFLAATFCNMKEVTKAGGGMYIFHSTSTQIQFEEALKINGIKVRNQLIWNKPMAALGWGDYRWKHEPFFYAGVDGQQMTFYGDRTHSTVIDFQKSDDQLVAWAKRQRAAEKEGRTTIWTMKREKVQDYVHPTQKPVELITYALGNSSKADDLIFDPFLGSGSTIIACDKMNRICYGLELDPKFMDVIVDRYCTFTGNHEIVKNGEKIVWSSLA